MAVDRRGNPWIAPRPTPVRLTVTTPSTNRKPIIGLAGGVGSGKSYIASLLEDLGCMVIDADASARAALKRNDVKRTLIEWWGEGILDEHGHVDRRQLADRVFDAPDQRKRLEVLIHPLVAADRDEQIRLANADPDVRAVVLDVPLLFEVGLDEKCDRVIFVDAPRATRLKRVSEQRGWTEKELDRREKNQLPLDTKRAKAHNVISNDSESDRSAHLRDQLRRILETC